MHYSTILENFNSFSPYLIQPDFSTVANKNLTKNSESLYFSRLSALSCLLHTQEVHGSSPCVSTRSKSPESVDIQRLRGFFVLQIGAFLYFSYNLKRPDFLTVANKNLTNFLGQIELTASLSCAISMCV